MTDFANHQHVLKLVAFLIIQTAYVIYIMHAMPHTESMFNKLELFNEGMIILMCYIMFVFAGVGNRDILASDIPLYACMAISALIVVVNVFVMLRLYLQNARMKIHERKMKKAGLTPSEKVFAKAIELGTITPAKEPLNASRTSLMPLYKNNNSKVDEESSPAPASATIEESFDDDRAVRKDIEDLSSVLVS